MNGAIKRWARAAATAGWLLAAQSAEPKELLASGGTSDPLVPTVGELRLAVGYRVIARGLKELEGWFYEPGRSRAPWNAPRRGQPYAEYGDGEFPVGGRFDVSTYSPPPCLTREQYLNGARGGGATRVYAEYLRECQERRRRDTRPIYTRTPEWKFLQTIDLHNQVNRGRFPPGQFLTARLGSAEHQYGSAEAGLLGYFIQTVEHPYGEIVPRSPLIRASDWYFRLTPDGTGCISGSFRLQLPGAVIQLEPKRLLVNWADHGWGVRFPGARIHIDGLSAEPTFLVCVDAALQPTATIQSMQVKPEGVRFVRNGGLDVDLGIFGGVPGVGTAIDAIVDSTLGLVVDEIATGVFDDRARSGIERAFGRVRQEIDERARAAADEELQKLMAALPRVQDSLRDGCSALRRALDDGILSTVAGPRTAERVREIVGAECARIAEDPGAAQSGPFVFRGTPEGESNSCYAAWTNVDRTLDPRAGGRGRDCGVEGVLRLSLPAGLWPVMSCVAETTGAWLDDGPLPAHVLARDVKLDCLGPIVRFIQAVDGASSPGKHASIRFRANKLTGL
ncbi:MAG: hypothetical protein HY553_03390 [Elusimicrobia bacterium]|nr:hypothetical protein [Elusimicrobiota bacterium]